MHGWWFEVDQTILSERIDGSGQHYVIVPEQLIEIARQIRLLWQSLVAVQTCYMAEDLPGFGDRFPANERDIVRRHFETFRPAEVQGNRKKLQYHQLIRPPKQGKARDEA